MNVAEKRFLLPSSQGSNEWMLSNRTTFVRKNSFTTQYALLHLPYVPYNIRACVLKYKFSRQERCSDIDQQLLKIFFSIRTARALLKSIPDVLNELKNKVVYFSEILEMQRADKSYFRFL